MLIEVVIDEDSAPSGRPLVLAPLTGTLVLDFHPALKGWVALIVLPQIEIFDIRVES
jgi:hypothetical protein